MKKKPTIAEKEFEQPLGGTVADYERWLILSRLVSCNYRLGKTAVSCGINRNTLRSKLVEYGVLAKESEVGRQRSASSCLLDVLVVLFVMYILLVRH